jgi:uncharacterized repeat protein (TIGR02543 family)
MKRILLALLTVAALLTACVDGSTDIDKPIKQDPPTTCTVKFNLDGGKIDGAVTLADVTVTKGSSLGDNLKTPSRDGSWRFDGWFDSEAADDKYEADTPINKDLTLKAKWSSTNTNKWVVTFDTDGGTPASIESIQVTKGESMGDQYPDDPTKDRHEFEGWYSGDSKYEKNTPAITANTDLKAKWKSTDITIVIEIIDNEGDDNVTATPESGQVGEEITINYTLAGTKHNNRLSFSGTAEEIEEVDTAGTGTRTYTITAEDASDGIITIIATFTHSNKTLDTIAFADNVGVDKTYGDAPYTKAITESGEGTGAITYESSNETVATVNSSTGEVTILKAGSTTITATKAEDATYSGDTASYVLTVEPLQLTIGTPTITPKAYDGNATANVTPGTLTNVVGGDTVSVTAVGTYASANAGTGITITIVYSIDGADADNYIAPVEGTATGSITKANGADVNTNPTAAAKSDTTITSSVVTVSNSQTVEYAISTAPSPEPASGWQNLVLFTGLNAGTDYYIFARSKENANYLAGTAKVSSAITTKAPIPDVIQVDFTTVTFAGVGISAPTGANVTSTSYTYTHTGYSQGVAFKIDIGTGIKLSDYDKISFTVAGSGNDSNNKPCNVFGALGTGAAPSYIQPPGNSNAAALTTFSSGNNITSSPANLTFDIDKNKAIVDTLTGEIWLAIFIHAGSGASYTISDFTISRSSPPFVVDFTTVTFAGVGISAPTGANVTSTSYTYTHTNYSQGVAFKIDIGTGIKLSDYDKISFTVAGSGNDFANKPCNVFGALGTGAAPSYLQPPSNSNAAALTTYTGGNNLGGSNTFPVTLTFTINKNQAIVDTLTGEIWLAIFIHAGNGASYTISNFQLF